MLTDYSKPPADIAAHTTRLLDNNARLLERQRRITTALQDRPARSGCLVCARPIHEASSFTHRGVAYLTCTTCGHVQSAAEPPIGYPFEQQDFADIYAPLDEQAYRARRQRIFTPKLEWALGAAGKLGLGDLLARSWVDLGCGDGCFVSAVLEAGAASVTGLEAEDALVRQAQSAVGVSHARKFSKSLAEAVHEHPADIYSAWFVLEHCVDIRDFLGALREKPAGTIFMFSVPVFGFAALLENAFGDHYARNLDSVLHVQLFSDRSIRHAMDEAGFEIKAEWLFGQDADDLCRAIMVGLGSDATAGLGEVTAGLAGAVAGLQQVIDRARLADARHILAVRK